MAQFLQSFVEDIVYSVRGLRRAPFLAFAATITLAVSIGANTAVFSIADSILIRPLPYPNSGRIDWISERAGPAREDIAVAPDYYQIRDRNRIFEDVAEFGLLTLNWTGVERPEQLDAASASVSFFRVMGPAAPGPVFRARRSGGESTAGGGSQLRDPDFPERALCPSPCLNRENRSRRVKPLEHQMGGIALGARLPFFRLVMV